MGIHPLTPELTYLPLYLLVSTRNLTSSPLSFFLKDSDRRHLVGGWRPLPRNPLNPYLRRSGTGGTIPLTWARIPVDLGFLRNHSVTVLLSNRLNVSYKPLFLLDASYEPLFLLWSSVPLVRQTKTQGIVCT